MTPELATWIHAQRQRTVQRLRVQRTEMRRDVLRTWLLAHRVAWSGWPDLRPIDGCDAQARYDRLRHHGCPLSGADVVPLGDEVISQIRATERRDYVRRVIEVCG